MFLIENRCSDTTDIDELNSRDLRKERMKYRIKLLSDLRQRFRKEYLIRLKTQHGTVIRPGQRIFPLEVQAIANSDKELKEESISVKSTKPEKVLNTNDAIVKKYTCSGRSVKEPKRLDLLNYNCYRFETLPKSQREGLSPCEWNAAFEQGTGIKFLIPPSSVWYCHWLGVATWWMVVGGVSDAGTNGIEEGRLGEPSLPMEWMLGVSMDSRFNIPV
ncbi:integrase catalytic domain-containing protein [Trichonephila clavipes]|nr:integrase catalytic domain-containing protein [Trichonephila clavipes]